jgi:hypothetical protein
MEDDLQGSHPQWRMTSLAKNSRKQIEITRNEQHLLSNSFRSTKVKLKQSGQF